MRRADREITDSVQIDRIINSCNCCRIGFSNQDGVYIVPLNFGYERVGEEQILYFHGAREGRKVELAKNTPKVGFEMDTNYQLRSGDVACSYTNTYQSVIGTGVLQIVADADDKRHALKTIMEKASGKADWEFNEAALASVCVFRLKVASLTCKERK